MVDISIASLPKGLAISAQQLEADATSLDHVRTLVFNADTVLVLPRSSHTFSSHTFHATLAACQAMLQRERTVMGEMIDGVGVVSHARGEVVSESASDDDKDGCRSVCTDPPPVAAYSRAQYLCSRCFFSIAKNRVTG